MRKRNWPDGLYERDGYYSWWNPLTQEEIGIGRVPFPEACSQAIEANLHVGALLKKPRLVDRISGNAERSVGALIKLYDKKLEERLRKKLPDGQKKKRKAGISPITLRQKRSYARAFDRAWSDRPVYNITTLDAATLLNQWKDIGQLRMAQAVRSFGVELFRYAEAEGWIPRGSNPFTITDTITPEVRRARLSFEEFQTIYDAAGALDPWVRHAMALAIVSARRREDLAVAEFKQRPDSLVYVAERRLCVIQQKVEHTTQLRIRLPFELELKALGWTLEDVIGRCRDDVVSRWLIHHSKPRTKSKPGDQVWIDTITKGFRRARDRTGLTWPEDQEPPTFHEIRSLAARLYEKQGNVDVQALLGHSDPDTTKLYIDSRGVEWADVKIA